MEQYTCRYEPDPRLSILTRSVTSGIAGVFFVVMVSFQAYESNATQKHHNTNCANKFLRLRDNQRIAGLAHRSGALLRFQSFGRGWGSTESGSNTARSGSVVWMPPSGISTLAVQQIELSTSVRRSSICQLR